MVERWNQWSKTRHDLFNMFDLLVMTPESLIGVQATSGSNHAARRTKLAANELLPAWLAHAEAEIWSWSKTGDRGKRKLWTLRRERISL